MENTLTHILLLFFVVGFYFYIAMEKFLSIVISFVRDKLLLTYPAKPSYTCDTSSLVQLFNHHLALFVSLSALLSHHTSYARPFAV